MIRVLLRVSIQQISFMIYVMGNLVAEDYFLYSFAKITGTEYVASLIF